MRLSYYAKANSKATASQSRGFTLVELITVVAIIAILAGLILTALTQAKARVRSTQCQHNLRQQGFILLGFVHEHNEYPLSANQFVSEGKDPEHRATWMSSLFLEYNLSDWRMRRCIFHCPSAASPSALPKNRSYFDYGYNVDGLNIQSDGVALGLGGKGPVESRYSSPVRETEVLLPSSMIAMGDAFIGWRRVIEDGGAEIARNSATRENVGSTRRAQVRHRGKMNIVFCDGHVEAVSIWRLFESAEPPDLKLWNRDGNPHSERL